MIKVKGIILFARSGEEVLIDMVNPELAKFLNHPYKDVKLKYQIQNKIGLAIEKEIASIHEFYNKAKSEYPQDKPENVDKVNKDLLELLNSEVEIDVRPVKLSSLLKEDCGSLNFAVLDKFIEE